MIIFLFLHVFRDYPWWRHGNSSTDKRLFFLYNISIYRNAFVVVCSMLRPCLLVSILCCFSPIFSSLSNNVSAICCHRHVRYLFRFLVTTIDLVITHQWPLIYSLLSTYFSINTVDNVQVKISLRELQHDEISTSTDKIFQIHNF